MFQLVLLWFIAVFSNLQRFSFTQSDAQVRHYVGNYATFLRHAAMDGEGFSDSPPCGDDDAGAPKTFSKLPLRCRVGCAFCARLFWAEQLQDVYLSGVNCFMASPDNVWKLLSMERYQQRWPLIPTEVRCESVIVFV